MKSIVLLSGGIDSITLLHHVLATTNEEVIPVFFNYGQLQESKEKTMAGNECIRLGLKLTEVTLGLLEATVGDYIPSRNSILLTWAGHLAEKVGATKIYYGAIKALDIYVDCSIEYVDRMNMLLNMSGISLEAPFNELTKEEVIGLMNAYGIDIENTWSCNHGENECGECSDCIMRSLAKRVIGEEEED